MFKIFNKYKKYMEYLPLMLVGIYFVAEAEMEKHAVNTSCQLIITLITVIIFFLLLFKFRQHKIVALLVASALWVILVFAKNKYVKKDI